MLFKKFLSLLLISILVCSCMGSVAASSHGVAAVSNNDFTFHVGDIIKITPLNYGDYGPNFDVVDKAFSKCSLFESYPHIMMYGYDSFKAVKSGVETVEVEYNGHVYTTVFRVV
jgi:hypothetical protein